MKLLPLYESILNTAHLVCSNDGYVSAQIGENKKPFTVKGKRLVLPTPEHLANPDKERVIFHPLSENILRSESDVLEAFRSACNTRINYTFASLALELLTLATSTKQHAKLNPDQSEFLSKVKMADEKTLDVFKKIIQAMPHNQTQKKFVSIYLKRGGTINGKRHSRVGVVSFPFYEELSKSGTEVYGVKLRVKDKETLINLFEYMIPGINVPESHNRGSDSEIAPYLDALMKAVLSVASHVNDIVALFKKHIDEPDELMFEDGWVETFDNLSVMLPEIRLIPMQGGNEGTPVKGADSKKTEAVTTSAPVQQVVQQQVVQPPQNVPPWMYGQYYQPNPMPFIQQHNQGPVVTSAGLDFQSVLNTNPSLAQQVGGNVHPSYMQGSSLSGFNNAGFNYGRATNSYPGPSGGFGRL